MKKHEITLDFWNDDEYREILKQREFRKQYYEEMKREKRMERAERVMRCIASGAGITFASWILWTLFDRSPICLLLIPAWFLGTLFSYLIEE